MDLCWQQGALYLDTCIEPWAGGYTDRSKSVSQRSNYALREQALAFGRNRPGGPTAVITQGANPGLATRAYSWTPLEGPYQGFLITHGESIAIADHLIRKDGDKVVYRPTVLYAYHPCDDAVLSIHEIAGKHWRAQPGWRILRDDIVAGMDELGVLLMGNAGGVYWYGSRLHIDEARRLLPFNNATSMQVAAGVLAGMVWALRHPKASVVEPDGIDHEMVMQIATPYLGEMVGVRSDWTPLQDRGRLFSEDVDSDDPWQFKNIRVG